MFLAHFEDDSEKRLAMMGTTMMVTGDEARRPLLGGCS